MQPYFKAGQGGGEGGRGEQIAEKAADGKNWSHLLIVGLTLSGKKTVDPLS